MSKKTYNRQELIQLSGQIINGVFSSDTTLFSKTLLEIAPEHISNVAVDIASKIIDKIDEIDDGWK